MQSKLSKLFGYSVMLILCFGAVMYVGRQQPELINQLLISLDVFGITDTGQKEQQRLAEINQLILYDEQRQALISRTVFMGATTKMVWLALGPPKQEKVREADGKRKAGVIWIYHFPKDNRPTILEFEQADKVPEGEINAPWVLVSAYKGSVLDVVNGSNGTPSAVPGLTRP